MLIPSDRAAYRILDEKGFLGPDSHLYREGECIVFEGTPNEEMEPLNEPARNALKKYSDYLDDEARATAAKNGRTFQSRPRTLDGILALSRADARAVQLISGGPGVPLMGGKNHGAAIEKLDENGGEAPETGATLRVSVGGEPPKAKRGRPAKSGSLSLSKAAEQAA